MIRTSISRITGEFDKIRLAMDKRKALESGLRPVFRIETCKSLDSGVIGDRILANTIPWWVNIQGSDPTTRGILSGIKNQVVTNFRNTLGDLAGVNVEKPVIGIMIDEGVSGTNPYRYLVNVIFQNFILNTPGGNKWLGEDLLLLGFPLRISFGFINISGDFIQHPYAKTTKKCIPDFTGITAALTQEIFATDSESGGDRFQVTAVGFEHLLGNTICDNFEFQAGDKLVNVLARLLYYWATGTENTSPGVTRWPIPILTAIGIMNPAGKELRSIKQIENSIVFVDVKKSITVRYGGSIPGLTKDVNESFLDVLVALSTEEYTNTQISFNHYGKLCVQGLEVSSIDIATTHPSQQSENRIRVHDAVVGSNILHLYMNASMEQMSNVVDTFAINVGSSAEEPVIKRLTLDQLPTLDHPDRLPKAYLKKVPNLSTYDSEDQVVKYYGPGSAFGRGNPIFLYGQDQTSLESTWHKDYLESLVERNKYWGMRGGIYMLANPKIHVGDVIRVTDLRLRSGETLPSKMIKFGTAVTSAIKDELENKFSTKSTRKNRRLGLESIEDIYYVWKLRHYIGQKMFTTKVFLIKEPQALIPTGRVYQSHIGLREEFGSKGGT